MLKIITVCGLGVGSSLIMKITVDNAMKALGKTNYQIEHWDMGTVKGRPCDFIVTTHEFKKQFAEADNVIFVQNMLDVNEMKQKIDAYMKEKGLGE